MLFAGFTPPGNPDADTPAANSPSPGPTPAAATLAATEEERAQHKSELCQLEGFSTQERIYLLPK